MDNKIKVLEEYMNSLNYGMYIPNSSIFFIRHDEKENSIELILEAIIGIQHYSGARIIKYDCNNFKFYSYTGKEKNYKDTSIGSWIKKYEEAFKDKCKELFEGDNEMNEQKNIEATNLDELEELINKASELSLKARNTMYTLDETIEEIKRWKMLCCVEKEEDKIDILNDYMKKMYDGFLVSEQYDGNIIVLEYEDGVGVWKVASYNLLDKKYKFYPGLSGSLHYDEIMYHCKDFIDKVKELYEGE